MSQTANKDIIDFQKALLNWFQEHGRDFPWRRKKLSHYNLIVAEILLQRTRADTIANFYPQFIIDFPNWESLDKISTLALETYLKPLGLSKQRAPRLKELASAMIKNNNRIPNNRADLEAMPMMGQYIANATELLILKRRLPLLDVNMARLLERFFGPRKIVDIRYDLYLQKLAGCIADHVNSVEINWAILDFASLVCRAKNPICLTCIFREKCLYFNSLK